MVHGQLGYVTAKGAIHIAPEMLEHGFVQKGSKLYGIYYPMPASPKYEGIMVRHDLALSPIPFRLWPFSARVSLYLRQRPGQIKRVAEFFRELRMSIIHGESTRAGYRNEEWSFFVVFEDLFAKYSRCAEEVDHPHDCPLCSGEAGTGRPATEEEFRFVDSENTYNLTRDKVESLKGELAKLVEKEDAERDESRFLWRNHNDLELKEAFRVNHNTALAYFHHHSVRLQRELRGSTGWHFRAFELECTGAGTLEPDRRLRAILEARGYMDAAGFPMDSERARLLPATAFVSLDTRFLHLRVALIPPRLKHTFFELRVGYRRVGLPDASTGIFRRVMAAFHDHFNVWNSFNRTFESAPEFERGQIIMLIEHQGANYRDESSMVAHVEATLQGIEGVVLLKNTETFRIGDRPGVEGDQPLLTAGEQSDTEPSPTSTVEALPAATPNSPPTPEEATQDPDPDECRSEKPCAASEYGSYVQFEAPVVKGVTPERIRRKVDEQRDARGGPDIFLSYSHEDHGDAEEIRRQIACEGLDVFMAGANPRGGELFEQMLKTRLQQCAEVWVLCTEHSLASEWVKTEWGAAWVLDKDIVPVVLHESILPKLPERLRQRQTVLRRDIRKQARLARSRIDGPQLG